MTKPKLLLLIFSIVLGSLTKAQDTTKSKKVESIPDKISTSKNSTVNQLNEFSKENLLKPFDLNTLEVTLQHKVLDSFIKAKNLITGELTGILKRPISFNQGGLFYSGSYSNSYFDLKGAFLNSADLNSSVSLAGVPVEMFYKGREWSDLNSNNISISFDRENYIHVLKNKLQRQIDPRLIMQSVTDPLSMLKQHADQALKNQLRKLNEQYHHLLKDKLDQVADLESLINIDIQSLKSQYLNPDFFNTLLKNETLLNEMQMKLNLHEAVDTAVYQNIKNEVIKMKGLQEFAQIIIQHKTEWEKSGFISRIKEWEQIKKLKVDKLLNDPSTILKMAKEQLNLSSFQKFFLKINEMKAGQNSLSSSPLSMKNFLNNGALMQFVNKGKSAMIFLGKFSENASVLDMPFTNTAFSSSMARAIQLGKSNSKTGSTNISIMSFGQGLSTIGLPGALENMSRSMVITANKEFLFGQHGIFTTEISRSVSQYNLRSNGTELSSDVLKLVAPENFISNTSFALNYRDEMPHLGLSYQVKLNNTPNGYNNPGNPFLNTGKKEAGLSLRKKFFENRLHVSFRTDVREFKYNDLIDDKWKTTYSVIDARWKLNMGQFISLRYLPTRMNRFNASRKELGSAFDRLSVDGNLLKNIGNIHYNNYFSFSYQRNEYNQLNIISGNTSLGINSNQTFLFNNKIIYWNTQWNQNVNKSNLVYFNSLFNTEVGTSFSLWKIVQSTTSLSYNQVTDWYKQIGLRQSVSFKWREKFDFSFFIDARKNLELYHPLMFGQTRGEIAFHYILK